MSVSIIAVFLALSALLAHRAHTRTIYTQNLTISEWVYSESLAAGRTSYDAILDFLPVAELRDPKDALNVKAEYQRKIQQIDSELKQARAKADALEIEVEHKERAADRFDLGDAFLEASLVIISITLLTKRMLYWGIGLTFACTGIVIAATGLFMK